MCRHKDGLQVPKSLALYVVGPGEEVDIPYERGEKTEAVSRWVKEIVRFSSFVDAGLTPEPLATHLRREYKGEDED